MTGGLPTMRPLVTLIDVATTLIDVATRRARNSIAPRVTLATNE